MSAYLGRFSPVCHREVDSRDNGNYHLWLCECGARGYCYLPLGSTVSPGCSSC